MFKQIKVRNFKNFQEELVFNLGTPNSYEFNDKLVRNNIINDAVIVGKNATGKTNLGYAILDLTSHLTDNTTKNMKAYLNLFSEMEYAEFEYTFEFDGIEVIYSYKKDNAAKLISENLMIDGEVVIKDESGERYVSLYGAETLNIPEKKKETISLVKYAYANTQLNMCDERNKAFIDFMNFVQRMLWFSSTEGNRYIGYMNSNGNMYSKILEIDGGNPKPLEKFLRDLGIVYELTTEDTEDGKSIFCRIGRKKIPLSSVVSSGTRSLIYFYFWYVQMSQVSFVYIDEFDAFYHTELAYRVLRKVIEIDSIQTVLTTHNTDLISNEILRPDCIFVLGRNQIKSLSDSTNKALREAHNLQKMYKAGAFDEE